MENTSTLFNFTDVREDMIFGPVPEIAKIIGYIYLIMLLLVGSPGNALLAATIWRRTDRVTTDYYVMVLALVETNSSSVLVILNGLQHDMSVWTRVATSGLCKVYWYMSYMNGLATNLLMTAISLDRYLKTCQPFNRFYTIQRAKLLSLSTFSFVAIVCVVSLQGTDLLERYICDYGPKYKDVMEGFNGFCGLITFINVGIIILAYTKVSITLRKRHVFRKSLRSRTTGTSTSPQSRTADVQPAVGTLVRQKSSMGSCSDGRTQSTCLEPNTPDPSTEQTRNNFRRPCKKAWPQVTRITSKFGANKVNSFAVTTETRNEQPLAHSDQNDVTMKVQDLCNVPEDSPVESMASHQTNLDQGMTLDCARPDKVDSGSEATVDLNKEGETRIETDQLSVRLQVDESISRHDQASSSSNHGNDDGRRQEENIVNKTTKLVFVLTAVHLTSLAISWCLAIGGIRVFGNLGFFISVKINMINSIANPVVFYCMSSRFRRDVHALLCRGQGNSL